MAKKASANRLLTRAIIGCAEGCFGANETGQPDFEKTHLASRTQNYLAELPKEQRRLVKLLFIFVEYFSFIITLRPLPFSWLKAKTREKIIGNWRNSSLYPLRVLGDSVRATMTMMYLSAPEVQGSLGYFKTQHYKDDVVQPPIRPAAIKKIRKVPRVSKTK